MRNNLFFTKLDDKVQDNINYFVDLKKFKKSQYFINKCSNEIILRKNYRINKLDNKLQYYIKLTFYLLKYYAKNI